MSSLLRDERRYISHTFLTPAFSPASCPINYKGNRADLALRKGQGKINRPVLRKDKANQTVFVLEVQSILKTEVLDMMTVASGPCCEVL